jgi:hypothetical protein
MPSGSLRRCERSVSRQRSCHPGSTMHSTIRSAQRTTRAVRRISLRIRRRCRRRAALRDDRAVLVAAGDWSEQQIRGLALQGQLAESTPAARPGGSNATLRRSAAKPASTGLAVLFAQHLPQRRMLVGYTALLAIGTVLAAAARDPGMYILGHVLQGLCTSLLLIAAVPPLVIGYPASKLRISAVVMNIGIFGPSHSARRSAACRRRQTHGAGCSGSSPRSQPARFSWPYCPLRTPGPPVPTRSAICPRSR